ncbi:hypothetical protein MHZ90_19590 [Pantoea sp. ACRSH]|uniref:hypothetical protein n=1 Tax=unclassified Pantoea TaxID=2630326 RepID=UPI001EF6EE5E|nr:MULTISPECIES: hypothetical protein [unclassified Pantoea]MCG7368306.1 hypothetical protein [Pantoea sp. ACRSH]MCG7398665.1 hypothetical protein [Pantoea sp. ACRSC]
MKLNFKAETFQRLIAEANKQGMPVAAMVSKILDEYTNNLNKEGSNGRERQ